MKTLLSSFNVLLVLLPEVSSFDVFTTTRSVHPASQLHRPIHSAPSALAAFSRRRSNNKLRTIGEVQQELLQKPSKLMVDGLSAKKKQKRGTTNTASKRTRQRTLQPQQVYIYQSQRRQQQQQDNSTNTLIVNANRALAKELQLLHPQYIDPSAEASKPQLRGQVLLDNDKNQYAYIIEKPPGWAILGGTSIRKHKKRSKEKLSTTRVMEDDIVDDDDTLNDDDERILAWLSPEERNDLQQQQQQQQQQQGDDNEAPQMSVSPSDHVDASDSTQANLQRIAARKGATSEPAAFASAPRPSVLAWLKDELLTHNNKNNNNSTQSRIRIGNTWTAVAGATSVHDSGLVVVCPKTSVSNLLIESADYVAVVGTGGSLAASIHPKPPTDIQWELVSKLRKNRGEDMVQTVRMSVPGASSCSSLVDFCQSQFQQGIRGDPDADPLDRRSWRRLLHCSRISVSSLNVSSQQHVQIQTDALPDDIAVLSDRRNHLEYKDGSFLGRAELRADPLTTAYREINGVGDGFPGWTVDRYDKWLFVQHDPKEPKGPLPSIHDGNTVGVYMLESNPDRSGMGRDQEDRPRLLEGQPAPDVLPVLENGATYLVSLHRDLSTGIFMDQRPQRAWLRRNCGPDTRVLNCFAHTGAFSVAAATAGASTVSIDLSNKWLGRLPDQLRANGIEFDERHDCISGDCFDWISKLAKRGEKFDIVILDPPSSSVGGSKKKRWSIKNDMDELVAMAAGLVKRGGQLWTTTNSASMHPGKFAKLCKKGLDDAGVDARLERLQPMPSDFPSVGQQAVKNLVWRIL